MKIGAVSASVDTSVFTWRHSYGVPEEAGEMCRLVIAAEVTDLCYAEQIVLEKQLLGSRNFL